MTVSGADATRAAATERPLRAMTSPREQFTEAMMQHVVYTGDPSERDYLHDEMVKRCAELFDVYQGTEGLAAVFRRLHRLVAREQDAMAHHDHIAEFVGPVVQALYQGRHGHIVRGAIDCATQNRQWQRHRYKQMTKKLLGDPQLAAMQKRLADCLQPVYARRQMAQMHQNLMSDHRARALIGAHTEVNRNEPRAFFQTSKDAGEKTAINAINTFWNITHPHRPCRVAAGVPFGINESWHCVLISGPQVREVTGSDTATALVTSQTPDALSVTIVGSHRREDALPPVCGSETVLRASECTVQTLLDAARLDVPRAVMDVTQQGARANNNSKSLLLEYVEPRDVHIPCGVLLHSSDAVSARRALQSVHTGEEVRWVSLPSTDHEAMLVCRDLAMSCLLSTVTGEPLRLGMGERLPDAHGRREVGVAMIPGTRVVWTMRHLERHGVQCTFAGAWFAARDNTLQTVTTRVPRFGERVRGGDEHSAVGDVSRMLDVLARSGQFAMTDETSWEHRGVRTWCRLRQEFTGPDDVVRSVLACGQPLRWHVAVAASAMDADVQLPPIQRNETAPSAIPPALQMQMIAAQVMGTHSVDPVEVRECARLLYLLAHDCGRYIATVPPMSLPSAVKRRLGSSDAAVVRRKRVTSARTLNPDYPDAQPRRNTGEQQ